MGGVNRTAKTAAAAVAFVLALGVVWSLTVYRYESDPAIEGSFQDFRDAGYFSAQSLVDGNNPYDVDLYLSTYPAGQEYPILPPTYAALHVPFLVLDLLPAAVVFLVVSILAMVALSAWSLRLAGFERSAAAVLLVSAAVLVSNGGRLTLIFGQATVFWVAGLYLAATAQRDGAGAGGLALALTKPTFGGPATLMLAAWGRWRRSVAGAATAAGIALVLAIPIAAWAGGVGALIDTLRANWDFSQTDAGVSLETTMARVDLASTVRQFTGWVAPSGVEIAIAIAVVAVSMAWMAAARRRAIPIDAVTVVLCLGTIAGIYHLYYDLVILTLPTLLALRPTFAGGVPRPLRLTLVASLLVANFNVFHSLTFADRVSEPLARSLGPGLTGLAILVALGCALATIRVRQPGYAHSG